MSTAVSASAAPQRQGGFGRFWRALRSFFHEIVGRFAVLALGWLILRFAPGREMRLAGSSPSLSPWRCLFVFFFRDVVSQRRAGCETGFAAHPGSPAEFKFRFFVFRVFEITWLTRNPNPPARRA